jgi:acetyltransferase-like isoleucine patch superfamily enzyme
MLMTNESPKLASKLRKFFKLPFHDKLNALYSAFCYLKGVLYYRRVFGSFGSGSVIYKPMFLSNPRFMHIGKNVFIRQGVRLEAVLVDPENPPELHIGDNVNIEQDVQIVFLGKVKIADNVSITARCSLVGGTHPFLDVHSPVRIGNRLSGVGSIVEIGEGSFIGIGSTISMNVRVGKYVVIGAQSVVKKSIPDFSVAFGNPAEVIMRYDAVDDAWKGVKTTKS